VLRAVVALQSAAAARSGLRHYAPRPSPSTATATIPCVAVATRRAIEYQRLHDANRVLTRLGMPRRPRQGRAGGAAGPRWTRARRPPRAPSGASRPRQLVRAVRGRNRFLVEASFIVLVAGVLCGLLDQAFGSRNFQGGERTVGERFRFAWDERPLTIVGSVLVLVAAVLGALGY
jgi:hypothetical protein